MERDVQRALSLAQQAVAHDQQGRTNEARALYLQAAELLHGAHRRTPDRARSKLFKEKAAEYAGRAEEIDTAMGLLAAPSVARGRSDLNQLQQQQQQQQQPPPSGASSDAAPSRRPAIAARAEKRLKQARWAHEDRQVLEAKKLYIEASELFVEALGHPGNETSTARLQEMAGESLERAETLKSRLRIFATDGDSPPLAAAADASSAARRPATQPAQAALPLCPSMPAVSEPSPPATFAPLADEGGLPPPLLGPKACGSVSPRPNPAAPVAVSFTKEELAVLRYGSQINGKVYLPWVAADQQEDFKHPSTFRDLEGPLALSQKQKGCFRKWARPRELAYVSLRQSWSLFSALPFHTFLLLLSWEDFFF